MTFLELCQRLAVEAGVNNANGTRPTTVAAQIGELGRIVGWVRDSWDDLQREQNWTFMWERPSLTLLNGTSTIAGSIPPKRYDKDSLWIDDGSTTGKRLDYVPWDEFRSDWRALNGAGNLTAWTIQPSNTLAFNATANGDTNLTVERYTNPVTMTADDDTPAMPSDLHMLIVWKALVKYANFDEAGVQRRTAIEELNRLHASLCERCLPEWRLGTDLLDQQDV